MNIFIDFETYSATPIKSAGSSRYAQCGTTDVQCLAWAVGEYAPVGFVVGEPELWTPWEDYPAVFGAPGAIFHAHNAAFEIDIWNHVMVPYYGWPAIPLRRWRCTAAQAAHAGLPRSLEKAASTLGVAEKDMEGHRVMLSLCTPQWGRLEPTKQQTDDYAAALLRWRTDRADIKKLFGIPLKDLDTGEYDYNFFSLPTYITMPARPKAPLGRKIQVRKCDPERMERLYEYCRNDVRTEIAIHKALPPLPDSEQLVWQIDRTINERGVPVDLDLCRGAVKLLAEHGRRSDAKLAELTEGRVERASQRDRVLNEIRRYNPALPDVKRETLESWPFTNPIAHDIAAIRRNAGAASVKKMAATLAWADADGRCRNTMYYYAAGTGRWGGRGPQFQNMKRGTAPSEDVIAAITAADYDATAALGNVIELISSTTRSIVCAPPGYTLIQSDYASVEARVLAWLANDEPNLEAFAAGRDIYKALASRIFHIPEEAVQKPGRQVGKIGELGLGYGCGSDKFHQMCLKAGINDVSPEMAFNVVDVYRNTHPNIVNLWRWMENTAMTAMREGQGAACGPTYAPIVFEPAGAWLTMKLPSGRKLYYYKPEIADSKFGKPSLWYMAHKGRVNAYGGLLVENAVQAISRDLLVFALRELERAGPQTVLHVHDSVLVEAKEGDTATEAKVHEIMSTVPDWCEGLPLKAETISNRRMK